MPRIPRAIIDEMVAHAREDLPNEACGLVHAKDGIPTAVHRTRNAAVEYADGTTGGSPYRYVIHPLDLLRLERQRNSASEDLFAIYHSHVASEAVPSPTDVRTALMEPSKGGDPPMFVPWYPGTYYILVSLAHEPPQVRAWKIGAAPTLEVATAQMQEEPIEVV